MIGEHVVTLIPDPDVLAWGPALASNPFMTANIAGWEAGYTQPAWTWRADGWAVSSTSTTGGVGLYRAANAPIPRDASTMYRVKIRCKVAVPGWIVPGLFYGKTPGDATNGPFWVGDAAMAQDNWQYVGTAGTYTIEATFNPASIPAAYAYLGPHVAFFDHAAPEVDSFEFNGQGAVQSDISCLVDQVSIHYGRDDSGDQPEAATASLDLSLDTGDEAFPAGIDVGSFIRVTTVVGTTESVRFLGRVTDLNMSWRDDGENTPDALAASVVCASSLADLGRRVVGDVPWPQELDGARVARILSNAGVTVDPTYSDPGTLAVLARDVDAQSALALAQEAAVSASGVVWETRTGEVRYADSDHRKGGTPALTLDACDILVTPTWRRTTEGLINRVSVGYGVAPDGGEQPRYDANNATSVDQYGRYELSESTQLATLADATARASLLLVRNSSPVWIMAALPVDVAGLTAAETVAVLGLQMHALITLTGLPSAGSAPTSAALWVEGLTETLTFGGHELSLAVSGYCRTAPPPRWDNVDPGATWANVSGTWDAWACIGPQPSHGRWADISASQRWATIPASVTWDTWPY